MAASQLAAESGPAIRSLCQMGNATSLAWHAKAGFQELIDYFVATRRARMWRQEINRLERRGLAAPEHLVHLADHWSAEEDRLENLPIEERFRFAQLAGVPMTFGQELVMMLTLMLTSKGVAGVPRAALVVLTATLTQFGLPLEGAAILLGIDQIMDMGRTSVNVMGNCIATVVVARWEGVFDDARMNAFAGAETHKAA